MTSYIQLLSFAVSIIYGIIFAYLTKINFWLLKSYPKIIINIITSIFVIDMATIYVIILYKINNGYFHLYFIIILIISFLLALISYDKIKSKILVNGLFRQLKNK